MATSSKSAGTLHSSGSEAKTGNIATLPGGFCASEADGLNAAFNKFSSDHSHKLYRLGFQAMAVASLLREAERPDEPLSDELVGVDYLVCQLREELRNLADGFPETLHLLMKREDAK